MARLQPRDYLTAQTRPNFGKSERPVQWRDDLDLSKARYRVGQAEARLHHQIACYARDMRGPSMWHSWQAVVDHGAIEVDAQQLRAIMRGQATLTLRHIAALELILGTQLIIAGHHTRPLPQRADP